MNDSDGLDEAPTLLWSRPPQEGATPGSRDEWKAPTTVASDVLTADEVAGLLRVDRKTVYDAAGRGELPHRRLGKRLVFSRAALLDWLACKPASKE
jgi:excisionase family DNA binding protein